MNRNFLGLGRVFALVALGGVTVLTAQSFDSYDPFMKVRFQTGAKTDEGQRNGFGVGFGTHMKFRGATLGLEFGYTATPGQIVVEPTPANTIGADATNSVLTKKHSTEVFAFRASFGMPINQDWAWQVGLSLGTAKDMLETVGSYGPADAAGGAWGARVDKTSITAAPFAGVSYKLTESGSIEFNAVFANNKRANVTPVFDSVAGTVTPSYGSKSYSDLRFEVGYVFHF
jgi:hypothetical protein